MAEINIKRLGALIEFVEDIKKFTNNIIQLSEEVERDTAELSKTWEDKGFQKFKVDVDNKTKLIKEIPQILGNYEKSLNEQYEIAVEISKIN